MADRDDLFQEKDGGDPQDPDANKPASEEDDDIIDLLDTVDTPNQEEDVIELSEADMIKSDDADIVDLTEVVEPDDVIELEQEVEPSDNDEQAVDLMATSEDFQPEPEDDVLELSDVVKTLPPEDNDVLELTQEIQESDEDDIIDLTETVASEPVAEGDGILELTEVADEAMEDEAILDLTEVADASATHEEIVELTDPVSQTEDEPDAATADVSQYEETIALGDEAPIELTQEAEPVDEDEIVDLTEAVTATETKSQEDMQVPAEFAETIELDKSTLKDMSQVAGTSEEDEVIELIDTAAEASEPPEYEETIDLNQQALADGIPQNETSGEADETEEPEKVSDAAKVAAPASSVFFETMELDQSGIDDLSQAPETSAEDEIVELTDEAEAVPAVADYEETINLDQQAFEGADSQDDAVVDAGQEQKVEEPVDTDEAPIDYEDTISLDQATLPDSTPDESHKTDEAVEEPVADYDAPSKDEPVTPLPQPYEEDKELLELIDDIQATLDTEPQKVVADGKKLVLDDKATVDADVSPEKDAEPYELIDDNTVFADPDFPDAESELYDNLGIDLTSELERKAFEEAQEAAIEDGQPPEDASLAQSEKPARSDSVKRAMKEALADMLAEEDNPLTKAIENAVRKALGQ